MDRKVDRQLIQNTNDYSFFDHLRNGIKNLDETIDMFETITIKRNESASNDQRQRLPEYYFEPETSILNNSSEISIDVQKLYSNIVNENIINLDDYENRLFKLRERLLQFENDDRLLSKNYVPFRPKDNLFVEDNDDELITSMDAVQIGDDSEQNNFINFDNTNNEQKYSENNGCDNTLEYNETPLRKSITSDNDSTGDHSFNILSIIEKTDQKISSIKKQPLRNSAKKSKVDLATCDNPMVKRALEIYNRWVKTDTTTTNLIGNDNINNNFDDTPVPNRKSLKQTNYQLSSRVKNNNHNNNGREINRKLNEDAYETIEFTPGMTTKIRKS